ASRQPAAKPSRSRSSGVMGDSPTRPRTPSVPKYLRLMKLPFLREPYVAIRLSLSVHRAQDRQRIARGSHVVHAHDLGAVLYRDDRRGDACGQPVVGRPAGDGAQAACARPAGQDARTQFEQTRMFAQRPEIVFYRLAEAETG